VLAIGVGAGVAAVRQAASVIIKRHTLKCLIIQNLLWRMANSE
jgi:hypothetical protein